MAERAKGGPEDLGSDELVDRDGNDGTEDRENYKVGYGKPPKSGQFKKGRSGNPNGRPKGTKSFSTIVREGLGIEVKIGGSVKIISLAEAVITRTFREAASGNKRAVDQSLRLMEKYADVSENTEDSEAGLRDLTMAELEELSRLTYKIEGKEDEYHARRVKERDERRARIRMFGLSSDEGAAGDEIVCVYVRSGDIET